MAGYNGIMLSFGEGADGDTVRWLLRPLAMRLVNPLVARVNGADYWLHGMPDDERGYLQVRLQPVDSEGNPVGDPFLMPFDDVETLRIY